MSSVSTARNAAVILKQRLEEGKAQLQEETRMLREKGRLLEMIEMQFEAIDGSLETTSDIRMADTLEFHRHSVDTVTALCSKANLKTWQLEMLRNHFRVTSMNDLFRAQDKEVLTTFLECAAKQGLAKNGEWIEMMQHYSTNNVLHDDLSITRVVFKHSMNFASAVAYVAIILGLEGADERPQGTRFQLKFDKNGLDGGSPWCEVPTRRS